MEKPEVHDAEIVENQDDSCDLPDESSLVPQMNVVSPDQPQIEQKECPVTDEMILGVYDEVLEDIRGDRKEIDGLLANFVDMVINEGDSTTASKEALVRLMELKLETAEKKSRIADLMTRVKLKERDTYKYSGPHMNATQNNTYVLTDKRDMLRSIKHLQNKIMKGKG